MEGQRSEQAQGIKIMEKSCVTVITLTLKRRSTMNRMMFIAAMVAMLGISGAQAAGDVQAGNAKATAAGCAACHGPNGEGNLQATPPNPKLAGKSEAELAQALNDYKSGKKPNPVMKASASSLSDADIANLAAFYASKK